MKWWPWQRAESPVIDADLKLTFNEFIERLARASMAAGNISVTLESALTCSAVHGVIRAMTNAISSYPVRIEVWSTKPGGRVEKQIDESHSLAPRLRKPNAVHTSAEFFSLAIQHVALAGNFYALKGEGKSGPIKWLRPVETPEAVTLESVNWGSGPVWQVSLDGKQRPFGPREILHFTNGILSADGVTGVSTIAKLKNAIGVSLAAEGLLARLYGNNDVPPYVVTGDSSFADEATYKRWMETFAKMLKESRDAGSGSLMLPPGMQVKELSFKPIDALLIDVIKQKAREIFAGFGVPPHKVADLERATFCLPAGTQVATPGGPVPIESIQRGGTVWSYASDGWRRARVLRSGCTGEDEITEIRTTNRTLYANARHRVLVRRKRETPRTTWRRGAPRVVWSSEYVPVGSLNVGDVLVTQERLPGERRDVSEALSELCGLILGDGNVYPGWGVSIARAADAPYMDHYRESICATFSRYVGGNGRGDQTVVALAPVSLQEGERQTKFASVLAARQLERLGLCRTARTKRVPSWVFEQSEPLRLAFLRGFLDADGSVDKLGRISFSSCNEEMLGQVRSLCMSCGVPVTNLRCQRGATRLPNAQRVEFEQWSFTCSDPGANRRIGSHDPRYIERLERGRTFSRKGRSYPWHGGRGFSMPGCALARIVALIPHPAAPVYDLEVEGTHNFSADGVVVHNSNIEELDLEFVRDTMEPHVERFSQAMGRDLLTDEDVRKGVRVRFDTEQATEGKFKDRVEAYAKAYTVGVYSPNDIRAKLGENPRDGGDEYYTQLNMGARDDVDPSESGEPGSGDDADGDESADEGGALAAVQ